MPYKEHKVEKIYWNIGEVAKEFDIATSNIRFWLNEFEIDTEKRDKTGHRKFNILEVGRIEIINSLCHDRGITLGKAKEFLKDPDGFIKKLEAIKLLIEIHGNPLNKKK